jgi:MFS superfamily sulfate permease-like transporter
LDELSWAPAITFVLLTVLLLSLVKWVPKVKGRPIPWTVIIPLLTIVLGYLSDSDNLGGVHIPTLKDKYGELKARVVVPPEQSLEHYAQGNYLGVFTAAFGIAFVAVLETLISAKIAEQKTGWGFDPSRETLGIMICHAVCGAVGAMPPTGVFVRTALNFSLGATHKMSQVVNALAVFAISVAVMPVFSYLPQSSVAALLIFASVRMAPVHYMVNLWKTDKGGFGLLMCTCLTCVFTDPVYGLILGMVFALLRDASQTALAESRLSVYSGDADEENQEKQAVCTVEVDRHDSRLSLRSSPVTAILGSVARSAMRSQRAGTSDGNVLDEASESVVVYEPVGPLVYLTHEKHQARLNVLLERRPKAIVVSLDLTSRVDKDGSDALGKAMKQIAEKGLQVELCLPAALEKTVVGRAGWVEGLRAVGHVHRRRLDALRAAQTVTHASEASKPASPEAERSHSEDVQLASDI